jgi:hypothetical protein
MKSFHEHSTLHPKKQKDTVTFKGRDPGQRDDVHHSSLFTFLLLITPVPVYYKGTTTFQETEFPM